MLLSCLHLKNKIRFIFGFDLWESKKKYGMMSQTHWN